MASANDTNTKLLLHCDGADEHTTFTDSSVGGNGGSQHTVTAQNTAQGDTAQKKFGTASGLFDGDSDYLTVPDHADWEFGTGKLTIDFWVRFADVTEHGAHGLMTQLEPLPGQDQYFYLTYDPGSENIILDVWDDTGRLVRCIGRDFAAVVDTWYHIAVIRGWGGNANDWAITVDGVEAGTETASIDWPAFSAVTLQIGRSNHDGTIYYLNGWMDEIRIVKGIARWTANFEVPSVPYPDVADVWMGKVNTVENPSKVNTIANTAFSKVNTVATYQ